MKSMRPVEKRFMQYVKIDTQSDERSESCPSTTKQRDFAKVLIQDLTDIGMKDISLDSHGYIMATLPSNVTTNLPVIGFIAHMDTSPDMSGAGVKPEIIKNYNGENIVLEKEQNVILSPADFPALNRNCEKLTHFP